MKAVDSSQRLQLLKAIREDLDAPVTDKTAAQARAVREAVAKLPENAALDLETIDALGLEPGVRGQLVFQLMLSRYPELVQSKLHVADTLGGVFDAIVLPGADFSAKELTEDDHVDLPTEVEALIEDLLGLEPGLDLSGEPILYAGRGLSFDSVDIEYDAVRLSVRDPSGKEHGVSIEQPEDTLLAFWDRATTSDQAIEDWDLVSLKRLQAVLHEKTAAGVEDADPLLAVHRADLEAAEDGILPRITETVGKLLETKLAEQASTLATTGAQLNEALGPFAKAKVGQDPKAMIDAIVERLNAKLAPTGED